MPRRKMGQPKAPEARPVQAKMVAPAAAVVVPAVAQQPVLSAADRENPDKLSGEPLRQLAHRRGIARSELERMDDAKIRVQLRYLTHRQYADEDA